MDILIFALETSVQIVKAKILHTRHIFRHETICSRYKTNPIQEILQLKRTEVKTTQFS